MTDKQLLEDVQGTIVELHFTDGHVVRGRLLEVNREDDEIVYDVTVVIRVGPPEYSDLRPGTVALARLSELESFRAGQDVD